MAPLLLEWGELPGHAHIGVTAGFYPHVRLRLQRQAINILNDALSPTGDGTDAPRAPRQPFADVAVTVAFKRPRRPSRKSPAGPPRSFSIPSREASDPLGICRGYFRDEASRSPSARVTDFTYSGKSFLQGASSVSASTPRSRTTVSTSSTVSTIATWTRSMSSSPKQASSSTKGFGISTVETLNLPSFNGKTHTQEYEFGVLGWRRADTRAFVIRRRFATSVRMPSTPSRRFE